VIFYNNVRVLVFNHLGKLSKESGRKPIKKTAILMFLPIN